MPFERKRKSMHAGLKYTSIILIIYAGYCSFIFLMQRQMMFPRGLIPTPPESAQNIPGLEKIWLDTGFGKVEAWFLPPESNAARHPSPVVIFGHGNGELIDFWPDELNTFTKFGMGLLLVEYPGYGRSAGKPSQESICALAAKRPSRALILMSTFTSVRSFAGRYLVPKFLVRDPFDNIEVVRNYNGPILILHGKHDGVIPYSHGVKLHAAAPRSSFIAYDAGHNDCPPDWPVFWKDIESFLVNNKVIEKDSP
jgi:pimeloyl-ACP methyl ester carboxylesterase